jgi:membrane protein
MNKEKIIRSSEKYEAKSYELLATFLNRLVRGLFIFKSRKAEGAAAALTFYTIMSFCPLLLLTVFLYNNIVGNLDTSFQHVILAIKENIPHLAPWILKSIQNIVQTQIKNTGNFNWLSLVILFYGCFGFSNTVINGLHTLTKSEHKGGKIFEDFRSLFSSSLLAAFILCILTFTSGASLILSFVDNLLAKKIIMILMKYQIAPVILAISFFTCYYKWLTPIKVRTTDAFLGAVSFLMLLYMGKSFYWVYLSYMQKDFIANFGSFYTITEAVIWIYFIACSFFYGACVAYAHIHNRNSKILTSSDSTTDYLEELKKKAS